MIHPDPRKEIRQMPKMERLLPRRDDESDVNADGRWKE
jgi:hypothetical protein